MFVRVLLTFVLVFCAAQLQAQVLGEETQQSGSDALLTNQNVVQFQQSQLANTGFVTNGIFIRQIGSDNVARVTTASDNQGLARIDLLQNGDNNYASLVDSSREFLKNIVQDGDGNRVIDYSLPSNLSTTFQLLQQGDNLTLEKFGTNSLTEQMQVNMTGSARTVIIRSF